MSNTSWLVAGASLLCFVGCDVSSSHSRGEAPEIAVVSIDSLASTRTVELQPRENAPLVRVSGVGINSTLDFAVADASEGNVKWYDSSGTMLRVLGRRGSGPGEFLTPIEPQFDGAGNLHVLDVTLRRISRWNQDGALLGETPLPWAGALDDFVVIDTTQYVVGGSSSNTSDRHSSFLIDHQGDVQRSWILARDIRPSGVPNSPIWNSVRRTVLTAIPGGFAAASTLGDSLWTVDVRRDSVIAISLPRSALSFSEPPEVGTSRLGLRAWIESLKYPTQLATLSEGRIAMASAGGPYFQLESSELWILNESTWLHVRAAPPIVGSHAGTLAVLEIGPQAATRLRLLSATRP